MTLSRIAVTIRSEDNILSKLEAPVYDKTPKQIEDIAAELTHRLLIERGIIKPDTDKEIEI
jgi:hypothetical protein